MKTASEHAETQRGRARKSVEEGFLLDGIALQSVDISIGNAQRSLVIEPDFTDTGKSGGNRAPMSAGETPDTISVQRFVQFARACVTRK
jgi:hypothetical protein